MIAPNKGCSLHDNGADTNEVKQRNQPDSGMTTIKSHERREFLCKAGISGILASLMKLDLSIGPASAHETVPQQEDNQFLAVSRVLTGYSDLDPILSSRLKRALAGIFPDVVRQVCSMATTLDQNTTSDLLMANAGMAHDALLTVNAAWYMGSIQDRTNAPMVAYADALMYRPVKDALPVPTYCFAEPGWWSQPPPLDHIAPPPINEVPSPPPPTGVLGSTPHQSATLTPIGRSSSSPMKRQTKDTE